MRQMSDVRRGSEGLKADVQCVDMQGVTDQSRGRPIDNDRIDF
jgi:hypothetical protein